MAAVWLSPRSSADAVLGPTLDAAGRAWLKVRVTATPEKGKANAALIKLLAKEWGLSPSRLAIASGAKERRKRVLIRGGGRALLKALEPRL